MDRASLRGLSALIFFIVVIAGFCSLRLALHGQSAQPGVAKPGQPQSGAPQDQVIQPASVLKVTTRLVLVDAVATDHKGAPVTDLKQDEFTILEDGKPQSVRVFSFQKAEANPVGPEVVAGPTPPPNVVTNIRRFTGRGPLNVLLLDGINTRMNNQEYVKSQVVEFLKRLPADQPLAIFLLGTRLQLLQDFTSDPAVLKDVVAHLKDVRSPLMDNAVGGPQRFWLEGVPLTPQMKRQILEFQQDTESSQADHRVAITLAALRSLARLLAGYPGRKNLIWVSETFPLSILPNKVPTGARADQARRNYGQSVDSTATLLTDAQIAVYPIDARALDNGYAFDPSVRYDTRGNKLDPGPAMSDTADELVAAHGTMDQIAEDTGGRATYNRNDIGDAVRRSIDDGSTYYTLGYYPESKSWDGRFRKISVKVSRPGVNLHYRLGYFATDPEAYEKANPQQRDAEFNAALSPDLPAATALGFFARVDAPSAQTGSQTTVTFAVDAHALSFTEEPDGKKRASIECVVRAFSSKSPDKPLRTEAQHIDADLPPESYRKVFATGLPCRVTLSLPSGEYVLRLGVRDNRSGLIGTVNSRLTVAEGVAAAKPEQPPNSH